MRLAFEGFERPIDLKPGCATTLEINSRTLFARVVQSLVDGVSTPEEQFTIWDNEKQLSRENSFYYVPDAFALPYESRIFEAGMMNRAERELIFDNDAREEVEESVRRIREIVGGLTLRLDSSYSIEVPLDMQKLLKMLGFGVDRSSAKTLLDNLIEFMSFVRDIGFSRWIVFTNLKLFFNENDLDIFFRQAIFYDFSCLLLETVSDDELHTGEVKYRIDQDLLEY